MVPIRTDVPLRHAPWANRGLILVTCSAFLAQLTLGESFTDALLLRPGHAGGAWWQYLSYTFLHGDVLHLLFNMVFLYIFGNNVNDKLGQLGYLGFYLAGGVFAGLAHVLGGGGPVLGASGAVAGVTGAFIVLFPRARVTVLYFFILIGLIEVPGLLFVLLFFALDVFRQFGVTVFGGASDVAHLAHIGGTVFGSAVSLALLAARLLPRDQFDAIALVQRWNRRRVYRGAVNKGWNPYGLDESATARDTPGRAARADPNLERIQDLRASISEAIAHDKLPLAASYYLQLVALDARQVLSRQNQLDVANQLFLEQQYPDAVDAYEAFLRQYPKYESIEQVQLMVGLICARYVRRPSAAARHLTAALERLEAPHEIEVARDELSRLPTPPPVPPLPKASGLSR